MIAALVDRLAPQVSAADLVERADHTVTVTVDAMGDVLAFEDIAASLHVRLVHRGRLGWASGPSSEAEPVVAAALASVSHGPELPIHLPAPAPLADVSPAVGTALHTGPAELCRLARALRDRLRRPGLGIEAWAERSAGAVHVANTRGVAAQYHATIVGVGAVLRPEAAPSASLDLAAVSVGPPGVDAVEGLAREAEWLLGLPVVAARPAGAFPAWFGPRAVRTLLEPVLDALRGERLATPPAERPRLDRRITLVDDPHASGRPGSRPICDDGVPTAPRVLIDQGVLVSGITDLVTAARLGIPATGHGTRAPGGAPGATFSNLRMEPGDEARAPAEVVGTGLLLPRLGRGPAPNRAGGPFRAAAPWALWVERGEVVGRLAGAVVSGNALELLARVTHVAAEAPWDGAWQLPGLAVDGVALSE